MQLKNPIKVLHVTDCLNAGVGNLIKQIIDISENEINLLLWDSHLDSPAINKQFFLNLNNSFKWEDGFIGRIQNLQKIVAYVDPDIVHAHSSMAGFYVRLFIRKRIKRYSPHCFSFDKLDVTKAQRLIFYFAERFLHLLTSSYVVNWPIEVIQASKFWPRKKIYFLIPKAFYFEEYRTSFTARKSDLPLFLAVGRIRPQKDPAFFARVSRLYQQNSSANFVWIGEGDRNLKLQLEEAGVKIVPWMSTSELAQYYRSATATLITSRWESGPLTLFESLGNNTPVILRTSKSSRLYEIDIFDTEDQFASECLRISQLDSPIETVSMQKKKCIELFNKILEYPHVSIY